MADVNSTHIAAILANPPTLSSAGQIGGRVRRKAESIETAAAHAANDVYRFFRVKSNAYIHSLLLSCDALASVTDCNIGLHTIGTDGAAVDDNLFDDAQTLAVALVRQEKRVGADSALGVETLHQAVWELLGLTADPILEYDVTLTSISDPAGVATITMEMLYSVGD